MMAAPPPAAAASLLRETVTAAREPRLPAPLAAPLRLPRSHWSAPPTPAAIGPASPPPRLPQGGPRGGWRAQVSIAARRAPRSMEPARPGADWSARLLPGEEAWPLALRSLIGLLRGKEGGG